MSLSQFDDACGDGLPGNRIRNEDDELSLLGLPRAETFSTEGHVMDLHLIEVPFFKLFCHR